MLKYPLWLRAGRLRVFGTGLVGCCCYCSVSVALHHLPISLYGSPERSPISLCSSIYFVRAEATVVHLLCCFVSPELVLFYYYYFFLPAVVLLSCVQHCCSSPAARRQRGWGALWQIKGNLCAFVIYSNRLLAVDGAQRKLRGQKS